MLLRCALSEERCGAPWHETADGGRWRYGAAAAGEPSIVSQPLPRTVRFAHPLNDSEERARFELIGIDGGRATMRERGTETITTCQAWEIAAAGEKS